MESNANVARIRSHVLEIIKINGRNDAKQCVNCGNVLHPHHNYCHQCGISAVEGQSKYHKVRRMQIATILLLVVVNAACSASEVLFLMTHQQHRPFITATRVVQATP